MDKFRISERATLREALSRIEKNHCGIIFVVNETEVVLGVATDGDIRRKLLNDGSLEDVIISCANTNFIWADLSASRESLLKRLDHQIRAIPILDAHKKLVSVITRNHFPVLGEGRILNMNFS